MSDAVSLLYGNDFLKFVITLNPHELDCDKIITRSFVIRGLKLHELKAVIQDYEEGCLAGMCIVDDLVLTIRDNNVLCVLLGSIYGMGSNRRIHLNDEDYEQFKFMVNQLAN